MAIHSSILAWRIPYIVFWSVTLGKENKIKQGRLHQTKELLHSEGNEQQQQNERPPTKWEKIFENISDKGLNKIHKELIQLNKQPD